MRAALLPFLAIDSCASRVARLMVMLIRPTRSLPLGLLLCTNALGQPLTTEFTYQGELKSGPSPASGPHDFRFRLYDAFAGGSQQGTTLCANNVTVANGRFTILLDFGAQFTGQKRFLEIEARADTGLDCSNVGGFVLLSPRQELTPAPNAAYALAAASSLNATQLGGQAPSFYTSASNLIGALPSASLSGSYGATVNISNPANIFAGSGAGLNNLNAAAVSTGLLSDARLSANIPRINTTNAFGNFTNSFLGKIGIGTTNPGFPLHIASTLAALALQDTGPDATQAGYISYRNGTGTETGWVGYGSPGDLDLSIINARPGGDIVLNTFGGGNIGIGTASPAATARLHSVTSITTGRAVFGEATAVTGANFGVYGSSVSSSGVGVFGLRGGASGLLTSTPAAIRADSSAGHALVATTSFPSVNAVYAQASADHGFAVEGHSSGPSGLGMYARVTNPTAQAGMWAESNTGFGYGVYGRAAVFNGSAGTAVFASGTFAASGTKAFRIDHPADPTHKYLLHYCTEAPRPQNSYSGRAILDERGEALVTLPDYFAAVNRDPQYTLTAVGAPMPMLHIAQEIDTAALSDGAKIEPGDVIPTCTFRIAGGAPGGGVSWRVEAVRNDRWVQQQGAPFEQDKKGRENGLYQHPELYGQPPEMGPRPRPDSASDQPPQP